jgi:gamma-glutamyltranspeptidase/glutathione hydrolase
VNYLLQLIKLILTLMFCISLPMHAADSTQDMVVTSQSLATEAGLSVLKAGGNAVDAAVAIGYALAVVEPCCGNIGGGGFMLIRLANGKVTFINFREKAPLGAYPRLFQNKSGHVNEQQSLLGYKAVATPGTVLGLDTALTHYGTLSRAQVMKPAILLAKKGYVLSDFEAKRMQGSSDLFLKDPEAAKIFLNHGQPYQAHQRFVQLDLAKTLSLIANHGPDVFYKGPIAKAIVAASNAQGGLLTEKDFQQYSVQLSKPISCRYRGYTVYTSPPPSSGGVALCEMLKIVSFYPLSEFGFASTNSLHYMFEAMRHAYFDRLRLGDPDFVHNPISSLLSSKHITSIVKTIKPYQAGISIGKTIDNAEGYDTTHYSVVDKFGNAVSVTYTINGFFGAKVIAPHTGFFLNNEMNDFTLSSNHSNQFGLVQGINNQIQPGKRPLSSMTPTIVTKQNKLYLVLGTPGGARIPTTILEALTNIIDYRMTLQTAINAPRFHFQWLPDIVYQEPNALAPLVKKELQQQGYSIETQPTWNAVEAIQIHKNKLTGANDKRRPAGKAEGQ